MHSITKSEEVCHNLSTSLELGSIFKAKKCLLLICSTIISEEVGT